MRSHLLAASLLLTLSACAAPSPTPSTPTPAPAVPVAPATTATAATAAPAPTPPAFRLPGDVRPTRASLELTVRPDETRLDGIARYDVEVTRATDVVWLHATDLEVTAAVVGGQPARVVAGGDSFVGLVPAAPLVPGATTIEVRYRAGIDRERSRGVYAEQEGDDWYAYTFFEAIDARRAFPGFDEPAFKIPWQLTFHVRREHVALGNAAVVSETDEADGMKRVVLAESKPLPSYLVAFVVGPFEVVDGGVAGRARTPVRFIVPKGRAAETRYAREVTPRVVTLLEDYFDMPYPYGKLDVAVVPRYWGTMEHPGIVAMGQPLTLIPPDQETLARRLAYANILTHELAHYWFGDVVTMAWWDDTWLNESLGSWLDIKVTDQVEPGWRYVDRGVTSADGAMDTDALLAARAMRQPVTSSEEIQASFDNSTTYAKGAAVLHMFEQWIGPARFQAFIRAYIGAHAWGNATADDFVAGLAATAGAEAAAAFRTFLEQPGVPLVAMDLRCTGGTATLRLSQRRALPQGVSAPAATLWHIPVCVRHGTRGRLTRTCSLLASATADLALPGPCPKVLVPNAGGDGYYRTAVTGITTGPGTAGLPRRERLSLLDDATAAYERGETDIATVMTTALGLLDDRDARVAGPALRTLWLAAPDRLPDDDRARFERLLQARLGARARKLGWVRRARDADDLHELRLALVSAVAEHDPALQRDATRLARAYLADPSAVPDDTAGRVLRAAVAAGDQALFDTVLAAARTTPNRRLRGRLLAALGAFREPALAAAARALVLAADQDLRESRTILYVQLDSRHTRPAAWAWVRDHLPALLAGLRDDEAAGLIGMLAETHCDPAHRAEAAALLTPLVATVDGGAAALAQGLEAADRCIADRARDLPAIRRFLERF